MGAKLGQLVIELAANTARLQSDLGKAVGMAESAAAKFKKAFTFVTAGAGGGLLGESIVDAAKSAIEFGDSINKAAIKAGTGGKAMSELAYAAKLADVDIGSLSVAIKKMQVALSEAGSGAKEPKEALAALGLTIQNLQRLKPEDQFELIGDRISKLQDPADRARAAVELFGKAGEDLLPLFSDGAAGLAKARAEAEKLGYSFGDDKLKKLADADDAIKRLSASWQSFATVLTSNVAPALTNVLNALSGARESELKQQIAFLEKVKGEGFVSINPLGEAGTYKDIGTGIFSAKEGEAMLAKLQAQLDFIETSKYNLGGRGRPAIEPGFIDRGAADAAKRTQAEYEKMDAQIVEAAEKASQETNDILAKQREADTADFVEEENKRLDFIQENADRQKEIEADVAKWRESQINATAEFFKDSFLQAFDDWINTGKFSFSKFLQYMAAEWARSSIAKLFNGGGSSSGGGGGWLSAIVGTVGSLFGGQSSGASTASWIDDFRADGGPVSAGKTYLVGERGMELFRPSSNGSVIPNSALHVAGSEAPGQDYQNWRAWMGLPPVGYALTDPRTSQTLNLHNYSNIHINGDAGDGVTQSKLQKILQENNRQLIDDFDRRGFFVTKPAV